MPENQIKNETSEDGNLVMNPEELDVASDMKANEDNKNSAPKDEQLKQKSTPLLLPAQSVPSKRVVKA